MLIQTNMCVLCTFVYSNQHLVSRGGDPPEAVDEVEVWHFVQGEDARAEANHQQLRGLVESDAGDLRQIFGEQVPVEGEREEGGRRGEVKRDVRERRRSYRRS